MAESPNLGKERDDRRIADWLGTPSSYFVLNDPIKGYCTRLGRFYQLNPDKGGGLPGNPQADPSVGDGSGTADWVHTILDSAILIETVNGDDIVSQDDTLLNVPVVMTFRDIDDGEVVQVTFRDSEGKLVTKPGTVVSGHATVIIKPGDLNGFINPVLILAYIGTSPPATRLIQYGTATIYTGNLSVVSQPDNSESTESTIKSTVTGNVATFADLQYSTDPNFATFITKLPVQATTKYVSHSQTFPGTEGGTLTSDTTYYVRWRLYDGAGDSILSDIRPHATTAVSNQVWSNTELHALPPGTWTELGASQTCYFDETWESRSSKIGSNPFISSRVDFTTPDGKPCFGHIVKQGDEVQPLGIDSDYYAADFSTFNKVLVRYRHWIERHSGIAGKWMSFHTGLGMIGNAGRGKELGQNGIDWGTAGAGVNTMHPERNDVENYIRMLHSEAGASDAWGETATGGPGTVNGTETLATGRWLTIDTVIEKNDGFKTYVDGVLKSSVTGINPVMYWTGSTPTNGTQQSRNWTDQKRIWVRVRCMHGGNSSNPDLFAYWDYREWFGGMVIMTSP